MSFVGGRTSGSLALVRSFDIPTTDAAYNRLKNLSWTYNNAFAVMAFLDVGENGIAEQLLDQLMALQRTDGSLDFDPLAEGGMRAKPSPPGSRRASSTAP